MHYHVQDGGSSDGTWERVQWWRRHVASPQFIRHCKDILFTVSQEEDSGLYDAIVKGFARQYIHADAFMTWINADDVLFPGALALVADFERQFTKEQVSWISGPSAILRDERLVAYGDIPKPTTAIKLGLCEGVNWEFVQQEGTFFRGWLWRSTEPHKWLANFQLAGDWNLWRLFGRKSTLVQTKYPLAAFRSRANQLSRKHRDKYLFEIDEQLLLSDREGRLRSILSHGPLTRRVATSKYPDCRIDVYEESITHLATSKLTSRFGIQPKNCPPHFEPRLIFRGDTTKTNSHYSGGVARKHRYFSAHSRLVYSYNNSWQYPAITEKHAFTKIVQLLNTDCSTFNYIAFPWATFLDHLQCRTYRAYDWWRIFDSFRRQLPPGRQFITVCQHIKLKDYISLFKSAGITHIFWSHCTQTDRGSQFDGIHIHPFPLYPAQTQESRSDTSVRDLIFSFVGATPDQYYLTRSRRWIFDKCSNIQGAHVIERSAWHYAREVYDKQIFDGDRVKSRTQAFDESKNAAEFKETLSRSIFSLCPSGTGPNSIRLWESLGAGAIPVIIADTLALPGSPALWEEAAVFCQETEEAITALPDQLAKMAEDTELLERKRLAMRQLWLMYGPDCFVYDILKLLVDEHSEAASPVPAVPQEGPNEDVPPLALVGVAREIAAGRTDVQVAGTILWRGLSTRASLSPADLRASVRRYPELVVAARMTRKLLATQSSRLLTKRVVEVLPELN